MGTAAFLAPNVGLGATRFILSTFKSDAVADEKLFIYDSTDGLNFNLVSATGYSGPSPGTLRDPSIIKYSDGRYYVAHTNPQGAGCCGKEDHFSIASSTDLVQWSQLTTVPGAIPNLAHVWAPEWFIDGSAIHIIANLDTGDADFQPYIFTALDGRVLQEARHFVFHEGRAVTQYAAGARRCRALRVVERASADGYRQRAGDLPGVGGNAGSAQFESATVSPSADSAGCSCKTSASSPLSSQSWLVAFFAAAALTLRRRYIQPSRIGPMA